MNKEIQYVSHIIPTLDWEGGLLGIRLRFEPKEIQALHNDYISSFKSARETVAKAKKTLELWPSDMHDFLDKDKDNKNLNKYFIVRSYILDPTKCLPHQEGVAQPQELSSCLLYTSPSPRDRS